MPFDDLETITKENMPPEATISYGLAYHKTKPKPGAKPRLTISIPTTLCGTSKSERFKILIGTGEDAGKMLVKGVPKGTKAGVIPSQHAHFFRWNFGYVPKMGDDKFEGEKRPVRKIDDETFEISVPPSWFEESQ